MQTEYSAAHAHAVPRRRAHVWTAFRLAAVAACIAWADVSPAATLSKTCLTGTDPEVIGDAAQIGAVRTLVDAQCACASFDGSKGKTHGGYVSCAAGVIKGEAALGHLRTQCKRAVKKMYAVSTCGKNPKLHSQPCLQTNVKSGKLTCAIKPTTKTDGTTPSSACANTASSTRTACAEYTHCIDAADTDANLLIAAGGDTGSCVLRSGDTCSDATNCSTHACVEGVCCNSACTGVCQSCTAAFTGSSDGMCAPATGPSCDDGDACTVSDTCATGVCAGTQLQPNLQAAITKEIDSVDVNDNVHLTIEIVTITTMPFELTATGITHPAGFSLESVGTECSPLVATFKCRHTIALLATSACSDSGDYHLSLNYNCSPAVAGCSLCSAPETVDFSLSGSNFCVTP